MESKIEYCKFRKYPDRENILTQKSCSVDQVIP